MKKILTIGLVMLMAGTAFAATPAKKVECNVKGVKKMVKTVDACKALGGEVVEAKKVA